MKIVLIGSGNVATQLGKALQGAGHIVLQVWSRQLKHAEELASLLKCHATNQLDELNSEADLYILSVSDHAIAQMASVFPFKDKLFAHTSGATSLDAITEASSGVGVFYPLQTFSKEKEVDFRKIPMAVEGNTETVTNALLALASDISDRVEVVSSEQRKVVHVAAVFACNFSNFLYGIGEEILKKEGLSFDLLRPLILETAEKAAISSPGKVQTGPARRNDSATIERHLEYLKDHEEWSSIYRMLTRGILRKYYGEVPGE